MTPPHIKLLLIDDEPAQAWLVQEHLRSVADKTGKAVELVHAETLGGGLDRLGGGDIDILLLDLSLPDSIGVDTFNKAFSRFPGLPIVVLTSLEDDVKTLSGLIPICAGCKNIRDDNGYWNQLESYISSHSEAKFSHGYCPACIKELFPEYADELGKIKN